MICYVDVCENCGEMKIHTQEKHAEKTFYFSLYNGVLMNGSGKKTLSYYKNKLIRRWNNSIENSEGYELDYDEYLSRIIDL